MGPGGVEPPPPPCKGGVLTVRLRTHLYFLIAKIYACMLLLKLNLKMVMKEMEVIVLVLISVLLGVFGQLSLKQGMKNIGTFELKDFISVRALELIKEKFVVLGIVLYIFATLLWLVILSKTELSFAYPLLSIGYLLIALFSKIFLNENVTSIRLLGILLISIGVFLLLRG